jgi:hypothetical protein
MSLLILLQSAGGVADLNISVADCNQAVACMPHEFKKGEVHDERWNQSQGVLSGPN